MAHPLDPLLGEWTTVASLEGRALARGRATFTRDGQLVVQQSTSVIEEGAPAVWHENAPRATQAVFGVDDRDASVTMLYGDDRGVGRVYHCTFEEGVLTIWRTAPGFHQRYRGTFSPDGEAVAGAWERSDDGLAWVKDFDLDYTRVSRPAPAPAPPPSAGA